LIQSNDCGRGGRVARHGPGARRAGRGTVQLQVLSRHHHGLFYHRFILISAAPGCVHGRDGSIRAEGGRPWGRAPAPNSSVSAILAAAAAHLE
jgi:hypothetical protein